MALSRAAGRFRRVKRPYDFAWLRYYPVWSVIVMAICIAIIWALTAHGRDIAD